MIITQIHTDKTGLRHISEAGNRKTYCKLEVIELTLIDHVVSTGTYCTRCHVAYNTRLLIQQKGKID